MRKYTLLALVSALVMTGAAMGDKRLREPERIRPPQLLDEMPELALQIKAGTAVDSVRITVLGPGDKKSAMPQEGWREELLHHLQRARKNLRNKDERRILLQADGKLRFKLVGEVIDICRKAEFADVSLALSPE